MRYPECPHVVTLTAQMTPGQVLSPAERRVRRTEVGAPHESWSASTYTFICDWRLAQILREPASVEA